MARIAYNGQSFTIDGRRIWILAASMQYARTPPEDWERHIAAARQAGFNTIETACPWLIHEPKRGRFSFDDRADVKRFVMLCAAAGMRVILRVGPYVGGRFDGGGLPAWLIETPDVRLRSGDEVFLDRTSHYFRRLFNELSDQLAGKGGPIILVQCEHAWTCANPTEGQAYLHEIARMIRECGVDVPVTMANELWQDVPGAIDTWRGWSELLSHGRQLRTVQPDVPRLVTVFDESAFATWGGPRTSGASAEDLLVKTAEVLAAGAQPVINPFHGGTNFDFLAGRLPGRSDAFATTCAAPGAPLGEAGFRTEKFRMLRRIVTFAHEFGHIFAELTPDYHPPAVSLEELSASGISVVSLRGSLGRVVFVFSGSRARKTTLLLDDGVRLPVDLGRQPVGWYLFDVDLDGSGRLDYANLCPLAIVNREMVLLYGPANAPVLLSYNGNPLQTKVPSGSRPSVINHKGMIFVICNESHVDSVYHDAEVIYAGVDGFDLHGHPIAAGGRGKAIVIRGEAVEPAPVSDAAPTSRRIASISLGPWSGAGTDAYTNGESPRFASLSGPESLTSCGAPNGYGWYRIGFRLNSARKRRLHLPQAGDRVHLYLGGTLQRIFGVGRGANHAPFQLKLTKGDNTLVALVDNMGRFADGNDLGQRKGIYGHLYALKAVTGTRPKEVKATPVHPFELRGFIAGRAYGRLSTSEQIEWTITHARKAPILIEVDGAAASGTFVLNDTPVAYYSGATGACLKRILIEPFELEIFKRGRNLLRFAPDPHQKNALDEIRRAVTIHECTEVLTDSAQWAFAKWEPPPASAYRAYSRAEAASCKGRPCWWKAAFELTADVVEDRPLWLDTAGLSKGQAFINGRNLGRYFTATRDSRAAGPQTRLHVPASWLQTDAPNEVLLFDEHGFPPHRVKLVRSEAGEFEK